MRRSLVGCIFPLFCAASFAQAIHGRSGITLPAPPAAQQTPVTDVQKAGTRLLLRDGETTVLAGLSSSSTATATRGAPGISSVPFLGALFRTDAKSNTKSELVIIITAKIHAPSPAAALAAAPVAASPAK